MDTVKTILFTLMFLALIGWLYIFFKKSIHERKSPDSLSQNIKNYLIDPPYEEIYYENDQFQFHPNHLVLIRKIVLSWDNTERGAPRLNQLKPFGESDLFSQLTFNESVNETDRDKTNFFISMAAALNYFIANAVLEPGNYSIENLSITDIKELMKGYHFQDSKLNNIDLGFSEMGRVKMNTEMIALVKGAYWGWSNKWDNEESIEDGMWPTPAIDPKRPYGDMSYIELDMHRILNLPTTKRSQEGYLELTHDQEQQLAILHFRLLAATQAFLENAHIEVINE